MELPELVSKLGRGSLKGFAMPADMEDPIRVALVSSLKSAGWRIRHHDGIEGVSALMQSESLDEGEARVAHVIPWPQGTSQVREVLRCLEGVQGGEVIGLACDAFPPPRTKETSSVLGAIGVPEPESGAGTLPWITARLAAEGYRLAPSAGRMLLNRLGSSHEALPAILRLLGHCLAGKPPREVTDAVVLDLVSFIPEEDGRKTLEDLLYQRALSLARRIEWVPVSKLVPLFRAAASEMVLVHQVATALETSAKGWVDPGKLAEDLGVREDAVRTRYLPLAKSLGPARAAGIIVRLEQADAVLLRTPHDQRQAALALAMQVCSV